MTIFSTEPQNDSRLALILLKLESSENNDPLLG
jgi:hypothetical protein